MTEKQSADRATIRRLLMYWGNVERVRTEKAERIAEIEQMIQALYDLSPASLTDTPRKNDISDPTYTSMARNEKRRRGLEAAKARMQEEVDEMDRRAAMIEYEVMCLPPLESEVIRLRYVKHGVAKKGYWQKIARRVHVSEDYAKKLEAKGVDKLIRQIKVDTIVHD